MSAADGWLAIVGTGPGDPRWMTPETAALVERATDLVGYATYLDRLPDSGQKRHPSDNREELDRARQALALAAEGRGVALISGGDPGVFAMAAAVYETLDADGNRWRDVPVHVAPSVSAMQAVAARAGAPLGNDFCVISLSDNLKPWELILKRLRLAAEADFAMALYNPTSRARPWQLGEALAAVAEQRAGETPVIVGTAIGRDAERLAVTTLDAVDPAEADMRTLIIIGASTTRIVERGDGVRRVYTPRIYPFGAN